MSYYASLKLNAPAEERRRAMARAKYQLGVAMRFVGQQFGAAARRHRRDRRVRRQPLLQEAHAAGAGFGDTLHHLGEVSERMQDTAGVFA